MPSNGHFNDQPRWYRLFLPLSVALLAHTLIVAGIIHLVPTTEPETVNRVRFTLVKPGNKVSVEKSSPATGSRSSASGEPGPAEKPGAFKEFTIPPITTTSAPEKTQKTQSAGKPNSPATPTSPSTSDVPEEINTRNRQVTPTVSAQPSKPSVAAAPSTAGERTPTRNQPEALEKTPRRSDSASEDPYVAVLRDYISRELGRHPVAKLRNLDRVRILTMELRLLESGVARRVDITQSSGSRKLDVAARRSALSASPYPEPPVSARERGYRYQVELRFSPNRNN